MVTFDTGVDVDALFVANSAELQNGLAYVLGAAWSRCWPPEGKGYPHERQIATIAVVRVPWSEANVQHSFRMRFTDSDDQDLIPPAEGGFTLGRQPDLTDGAAQVVPLAASPVVRLPGPGLYYISIDIDGAEKKRIQFEAIPNPKGPKVRR